MMILDLSTTTRFAADHLWQSTLTASAAGGLVWLLRNGEARLRHAIWTAASLKFLVPFALLVEIGRRLGARQIPAESTGSVVTTVLAIGQPFSNAAATVHAADPQAHIPWFLIFAAVWTAGATTVLIAWIIRWLRLGRIIRTAVPLRSGREADTLRSATNAAAIQPVPLLVSSHCMEPGICGVLRPALLWPAGISQHLDDHQLAAIIAHEVSHVRRRDNLLAALHMCVEALFWFHPLVWWMGGRLLEERERACDETVLRLGNEPARYADAILKACRFCIESPLACVSGVSGSDLKRRMVRIMNAATVPLSRSRKVLLAATAMAAVAGPIGVGLLHPHTVRADEAQNPQFANLHFTSATLTPAQPAENFFVMQNDHEFSHNSVTMKDLIAIAYGVRPERIVGGPDWMSTQRFNFDARWTPTAEAGWKVPAPAPPGDEHFQTHVAMATATLGSGPAPDPGLAQVRVPAAVQAMLRNFLAEHAALKVRDDSAVLPVYELVVANGGSKLPPAKEPQASAGVKHLEFQTRVDARNHDGNQSFSMSNAETRLLCENLSHQVGHEVVDKTGLTGRYDFQITIPANADPDQVAAILREQYGLDLQSTQQPVRVFAVDNVDIPQSN